MAYPRLQGRDPSGRGSVCVRSKMPENSGSSSRSFRASTRSKMGSRGGRPRSDVDATSRCNVNPPRSLFGYHSMTPSFRPIYPTSTPPRPVLNEAFPETFVLVPDSNSTASRPLKPAHSRRRLPVTRSLCAHPTTLYYPCTSALATVRRTPLPLAICRGIRERAPLIPDEGRGGFLRFTRGRRAFYLTSFRPLTYRTIMRLLGR
jgi:hypothetical protein